MKADEIKKKHDKFLFPCVTNYYAEPLVVDHAKDQYVCDIEGKQYLDFFGGILTVSVGHCNDKVTKKVKDQIDRLQHTSTLYPNEAIVSLAEKMAEITPGNLQKSFFTNSGTEANESAVQLARMATGNMEIIALRHGYSGHSMVAKSLTAHAPWRAGGIVSVGIEHAINPYCYRCPLKLTYPDCEVACADDVEEVIKTSTAGRIAAFLAEPIQGVGGFITPPLEYFKKVYATVKKYGGLFIADEVQTGFGRTGKKWFGIEHFGVEPDILTAAKGMANGAPVGATIAKPEIADKFQGMTLSTFGGNPVSATAARATIDLIEEENLLENTHTVGAYLREKLEAMKEKFPVIGDVRGMGLMQALELVKDPESKEPAPEAAIQLMEHSRTNGLLIGKGGLHGNVIRIAPPMNIAKSDVDDAAAKLEKSLAQVKA